MTNYPLMKNKINPRNLEPLHASYSEEYTRSMFDLYLTEELTRDQFANVSRAYRLHAKHPHSIDMALAYNVKCPHCSTHVLKQVGRCQNFYDLGLYKCPVCDKD